MQTSNTFARATLGALAAAAAFAVAPASAQTSLYAGGASLPSLAYENEFACYGNAVGTTKLPTGCAARFRTDVTIFYTSVGSGAGRRGFISNDPAQWTVSGVGGGTSTTPAKAHVAASDAAINSSYVSIYNNGGTFSSGGFSVTVAPASGATYPNPQTTYGPLIQVPGIGVNVDLAYDPVYRIVKNPDLTQSAYRFNVQKVKDSRGIRNSGLRLDQATYCKIFAGQITNWNDPALTALNNGVSLGDPTDPEVVAGTWSLPITIVVRGDGSGTTALFTRNLAAVCGSAAPGLVSAIGSGGTLDTYPGIGAVTGLAAGECRLVNDPSYANASATYLAAQGSENVSGCLNSPKKLKSSQSEIRNGRIGYLSADFVNFTTAKPYSTYALAPATLQNAMGEFVDPTPGTALTGIQATLSVPATTADKANPLNWVPNPSGLGGNPAANPPVSGAYPISGTTNLLFYTCYANSTAQAAIAQATGTIGFMNWYYSNSSAQTLLANNGFTALPSAVRSAIVSTFADASNTTDNLFIRPAPASGIGPNGVSCSTGAAP